MHGSIQSQSYARGESRKLEREATKKAALPDKKMAEQLNR